MNKTSMRSFRLFLILFISCMSLVAWAQSAGKLAQFDQARLSHQKKAMLVLGGWAAGNVGAGLILRSRRSGEDRYFHEMNALWNGVNLGIAAAGYWSATHAGASPDVYSALREHYSFEKILLLNAGLDVGYMAGGFYLMERAKNTGKRPERLRGYGKSIVVQGAFLFAFDLANYFISHSREHEAKLLLGATPDGVGLLLHF